MLEVGAERFDMVFAVNVADMWRKAEHVLPIVRQLLAPGGSLWLFHHLPGWNATADEPQAFGATVSTVLTAHGFAVDVPIVGRLSESAAVCIRAGPLPEDDA